MAVINKLLFFPHTFNPYSALHVTVIKISTSFPVLKQHFFEKFCIHIFKRVLSRASSICQIDILCQYYIMLNVDIDLVLLCHNIFYFVYFSSGYIYQQQFYKNIIMQTKTKSSCEYWSKTMTQITVNELRICLM